MRPHPQRRRDLRRIPLGGVVSRRGRSGQSKYGADALWYPSASPAGYLGLLLFVAAPCADPAPFTVPDFAEFRLASPRLRRVAMVVVVVVHLRAVSGAAVSGRGPDPARTLLGVPTWIGPLAVGAIVIANVVGGGMRSITFVQAFQYWLETHRRRGARVRDAPGGLPGVLATRRPVATGRRPANHGHRRDRRRPHGHRSGRRHGHPGRSTATRRDAGLSAGRQHRRRRQRTVTLATGAHAPPSAASPRAGRRVRSGGTWAADTLSTKCFRSSWRRSSGAMGLPHVLVRFYTNPDGRAARRSALAVIALLRMFYLFPTLLGALAGSTCRRSWSPVRPTPPSCCFRRRPSPASEANCSAGALGQPAPSRRSGSLLGSAGRWAGAVHRPVARAGAGLPHRGGCRRLIPIRWHWRRRPSELSRGVGLVFAVAASTLCPLLVLGIWWRGLTAAGAMAGSPSARCPQLATLLAVTRWIGDDVAGGWPATVIGYPAGVTVPLSFADHGGGQPVHPRAGAAGRVPGLRADAPAGADGHGNRTGADGASDRSIGLIRDRSSPPAHRSAQARTSARKASEVTWLSL